MSKIAAVKCDCPGCQSMLVGKSWSALWPEAKRNGWRRTKDRSRYFCCLACAKKIVAIKELEK